MTSKEVFLGLGIGVLAFAALVLAFKDDPAPTPLKRLIMECENGITGEIKSFEPGLGFTKIIDLNGTTMYALNVACMVVEIKE